MKKLLLINALTLVTACAIAQTDITQYYLDNYGFDENFNYTSGQTNDVKEEIKEIEGWTADLSANYTIVGVYEYGFKGVFNTASVPASGYEGSTGGGLAVSTGWEQTFLFYQSVTLPAGTYTLSVPTYNGSSVEAAISQVAWIPSSGTAVKSKLTSYKAKSWTLDQITFTLSKTTTGKIQFGMKAAAGGSSNSAKLFVDYVQLTGKDMAVDKTGLQQAITSATTYYGKGTGNGAASLKIAIDAAQKVADDTNTDIITVLEATSTLNKAIDAYRQQNISEENPLDKTEYILNPSFENSTNGWDYENLATQTNTEFKKKAGSTYLEKWKESGSVGSGYVKQVIKNLPNGIYKLTAGAQNYTQSSTNNKNTGAYIFAGKEQTTIYTPDDYSVTFTSIAGEVEIGFVAENATGNWIAVDNFRLYLIGQISTQDALAELQRMIKEIEERETPVSVIMSSTAAKAQQEAIAKAKLISETSTEADIQTAMKNLLAADEAALLSIAEYEALLKKIQEVATNAGEGYEAKEGGNALKQEIDKAYELTTNADATSAELAAGIEHLNTALLAFNIANATPGTGTAPKVTITNSYVATGATEALMRATMTGSNILERGVCWSTEHNPTVLDSRTTKSFSLNGYIFHVKGLKPATVYYLRPYVMNKTYTVAYGDEVKIVTHPKGTCTWSWDDAGPDDATNERCRKALKETIDFFNEWTGIKGFHLSGHYVPGAGAGGGTADCSYGGYMRISQNSANQAVGTVLHETGHGVGVGTHPRWSDKNVHDWKWLGREANKIYQFLENKEGNDEYVMVGDGTHGWGEKATYDWFVNGSSTDKHLELQYIGGCILLYGLFIDGLDPTSSQWWVTENNGIPGYTYNFDDSKKYYLMNKNAECGLGEGVLYQRSSTAVAWKPNLTDEAINDSAAWYIEFNPQSGYYMFKNAASGKYLTHNTSNSNVSLKSTSSPGTNERFQLMPDRTDVTIGAGSSKLTTHGFWFTWTVNKADFKSMKANTCGKITGYGSINQTAFDYSDKATNQQWIIISEDELEAYRNAAISTNIESVAQEDRTEKSVTGIYTIDGIRLPKTQKGFNIIRYNNGTTQKIYIK